MMWWATKDQGQWRQSKCLSHRDCVTGYSEGRPRFARATGPLAHCLAGHGRSSHHSTQVFQENSQREGHERYLEAPESFVPKFLIFLSTVLRERYLLEWCIMWYSRLPGMWTRDFKCTSYDWGVGTTLVSGRSNFFARHKYFLVPSKLAENDYAFPNTDQL